MTEREPQTEFERAGEKAGSGGPIREFWFYLTHSGKWWMVPIIVVLGVVGLLVVLSSSGAAPFIYTLF